jgi:YggT family protein
MTAIDDVVGLLAGLLKVGARMVQGGVMASIFEILMLLIGVVKFVIIAHVIVSWLVGFQVLNLRQPLVWQIWNGLNRLLEPIYGPIRRVVPQMGGLDLAPLVALLGVYALQIVLRNNAGLFY